ncbi:MAG TPA: PAS domain S-box protein [Candidatus Acidoferrales bacterium]|nr:PAS domain S-box protein [Candidatus Acidoferrales bacterium]
MPSEGQDRVASVPTPLTHPSSDRESRHVAHFYTDDSSLLQTLSKTIAAALVSGGAGICVATRRHRDELVGHLEDRGLNTGRLIRQGRLLLADAAETLSRIVVDGAPDRARFMEVVGEFIRRARSAANETNPKIAVFGEMVALLCADGKPEQAIQVEQFWNELAQIESFNLQCAYPISNFSSAEHNEDFLKICGQHSLIISSDGRTQLGLDLVQGAGAAGHETSTHASEELLHLLVGAVQDYAILMLDPEGRVSTWNSGAERIKGYRASEIIGRHFSSFYPEEDLANGKPRRALEVATREGRYEDEGWRVRKDGSRFWASVVITAVRDRDGKILGYGKVTRDFTERMRMHEALRKEIAEKVVAQESLRESERSLRRLSQHLLRTQDEERKRIGRDLHDSLGQYLSVLKMKMESVDAGKFLAADRVHEQLTECIQLAEESIKEVRTISYLLYPPMLEEMGLKCAIPWYLDGFTKRSGIATSFDASADFGRLSADAELAVFRVLQESLTNIHRHSGSPTAAIRLLQENRAVVLEISDRGKGMDPAGAHQSNGNGSGSLGVGLRGMTERMQQLGGTLEVASSSQGTIVTARIPMEAVAIAGD